ncbi:MAG: ATP-dependent sacrificial sulfur transferase LarE [Thermoplasmata archaeon]
MSLDGALRQKAVALRQAMQLREGLLVAFSGGVDSGLVCKLAVDALGSRALAVTAQAESLPAREFRAAQRFAAEMGIRHRVVRYSELANEDYARNPTNRCYFCRQDLGRALRPIAEEEGMDAIADGVLVSDLGAWRPGIQAMNEAGFWHPLVDQDIDKAQARRMARALGLTFHDKPSMACLSSRIPYGQAVTRATLRRIERAEGVLYDLGFRQVRVRHHGEVARVEVAREEVERFREDALRSRVTRELKDLGYARVDVDPRGYRTGRLNEALPGA